MFNYLSDGHAESSRIAVDKVRVEHRREIAIQTLQTLISAQNQTINRCAAMAVQYADALLAELEKKP